MFSIQSNRSSQRFIFVNVLRVLNTEFLQKKSSMSIQEVLSIVSDFPWNSFLILVQSLKTNMILIKSKRREKSEQSRNKKRRFSKKLRCLQDNSNDNSFLIKTKRLIKKVMRNQTLCSQVTKNQRRTLSLRSQNLLLKDPIIHLKVQKRRSQMMR